MCEREKERDSFFFMYVSALSLLLYTSFGLGLICPGTARRDYTRAHAVNDLRGKKKFLRSSEFRYRSPSAVYSASVRGCRRYCIYIYRGSSFCVVFVIYIIYIAEAKS